MGCEGGYRALEIVGCALDLFVVSWRRCRTRDSLSAMMVRLSGVSPESGSVKDLRALRPVLYGLLGETPVGAYLEGRNVVLLE